MEALTHPGGDPGVSEPGPGESWRELAEHSAEHDQLTEHPVTADPGRYARFTAWRRAALGLA
jgi:hypothetical protein